MSAIHDVPGFTVTPNAYSVRIECASCRESVSGDYAYAWAGSHSAKCSGLTESMRQHELLARLASKLQAVLDGDIDVIELRVNQAAWHLSALRALRDVAGSGQTIRQDIYDSYVSAASVWLDSQTVREIA